MAGAGRRVQRGVGRSRRLGRLGLAGMALLPWLDMPARADAVPVALELLLAVDTSGSVDGVEYRLQISGIAEAFRSPALHDAVQASGGGVAVAVLQWSDSRKQQVAVDWTLVREPAEAIAFADRVDRISREFMSDTAIGSALRYAIPLFQTNRYDGRRQVIDVSGDGTNNNGPEPAAFRDLAVAAGITVNGLAIMNENERLDAYYEQNVIGGDGAFVMTAKHYHDFSRAMLRKLLREIGSPPIASRPETGETLVALGE